MSTRGSDREDATESGSAARPEAETVTGKRTGTRAPAPGERWGRYRLGECLGSGGMGAVFAAHDPELDREVALKVVHDEHLQLAGQERLRREARAMARVSHPNVVPVYEVGEHAGRTFYTMELVRGRSLARWLGKRRPWREVVPVFTDAGNGLAAIHAAGMVHRDVKPGNILVGDDGRARIADLGIATTDPTLPIGGLHSTTTIRNSGTPAYMAPEQMRGAIGDAASDQFAFGFTLYEALTGDGPFTGATVDARLASVAAGPAATPADVPRWLDAIVRRAIAADAADRFPDVAALVAALARPRRRRWIPIGLALVALGSGAALLVTTRTSESECTSGAARLAATWDASIKARVIAAYGALARDAPYATATAVEIARDLDGYAASWIAAHDEACSATRVHGEQPESVMNARLACLDDRRRDVDALVALLVAPDLAMLRDAATTARTLPPIADCARVVAVRPNTASAFAVRDQIGVAMAHLAVGRYAKGREVAGEAVAATRLVGDRGALAEALVVEGRNELAAHDLAAAVESLAAAAAIAEAEPRVRIDAWSFLGHALQQLGRLDDAGRTLELAEAALRTGTAPDPEQQARVLSTRGTLLGRSGRYLEARGYIVRSLEVARAHYGDGSSQLAAGHQNLAILERRLGNLDAALGHARRALKLASALGADHPDVANARVAVAAVENDLGRYGDARHELDEALAIFRRERDDVRTAETEATLGEVWLHGHDPWKAIEHLAIAIALQDKLGVPTESARMALATAKLDIGDAAQAESLLRQIIADRTSALGPTHAGVADAHFLLGKALFKAERFDAAVAELERAQRIYEVAYNPEHPAVARALVMRAHVERERRRMVIARDLDARALAIRERALPDGHLEVVDSRLALADDWFLIGDVGKSVALAEAAVADLDRSGYLARARAWLMLAEGLWARNGGGDRPRALELARRARDAVASTSILDAEVRADVAAFLRSHVR